MAATPATRGSGSSSSDGGSDAASDAWPDTSEFAVTPSPSGSARGGDSGGGAAATAASAQPGGDASASDAALSDDWGTYDDSVSRQWAMHGSEEYIAMLGTCKCGLKRGPVGCFS